MDLFEKLRPCELAAEAMEKGIYPYFHALETRQDIQVVMEGKRRIMLGSNNYLGLTNNPEVIEAGKKALDQYGSGCSGSRFLNGTLKMRTFCIRRRWLHSPPGFSPILALSAPLQAATTIFYATARTTQAYTTAAAYPRRLCCATAMGTWLTLKRS